MMRFLSSCLLMVWCVKNVTSDTSVADRKGDQEAIQHEVDIEFDMVKPKTGTKKRKKSGHEN